MNVFLLNFKNIAVNSSFHYVSNSNNNTIFKQICNPLLFYNKPTNFIVSKEYQSKLLNFNKQCKKLLNLNIEFFKYFNIDTQQWFVILSIKREAEYFGINNYDEKEFINKLLTQDEAQYLYFNDISITSVLSVGFNKYENIAIINCWINLINLLITLDITIEEKCDVIFRLFKFKN
ncbi:hypothetical protein ABK040_001182 [Willaertia magna]